MCDGCVGALSPARTIRGLSSRRRRSRTALGTHGNHNRDHQNKTLINLKHELIIPHSNQHILIDNFFYHYLYSQSLTVNELFSPHWTTAS